MAKRRRKRRATVEQLKAELRQLRGKQRNRQEAIIRAVQCSADVEWLEKLRAVVNVRATQAKELREQQARDRRWSHIKTYWPVGTFVVDKEDRLFRVRAIRKIKQCVVFEYPGRPLAGTSEDNIDQIIHAGFEELAALPPERRAKHENKLFELGLSEIGETFGTE